MAAGTVAPSGWAAGWDRLHEPPPRPFGGRIEEWLISSPGRRFRAEARGWPRTGDGAAGGRVPRLHDRARAGARSTLGKADWILGRRRRERVGRRTTTRITRSRRAG